MRVIHYIRSYEDWSQKSESHMIPHMLTDQNAATYIQALKDWQETYPISLYQFRHRLQQITLKNLAHIGSGRISYDQALGELEDNDILVPTDDDDFWSPLLIDRLTSLSKDYDFVRWRNLAHGCTQGVGRLRKVKENSMGLASCAYAVRMRAIRQLSAKEGFYIVNYHWTPLNIASKRGLKSINLDDDLSCYNWHPGCTSKLRRHGFTKSSCLMPPYYTVENSWVRPYLTELYRLMQEVGLCRIKLS